MFSFFKDREDSSDNTLSRLSSEWNKEKPDFKYQKEETQSLKVSDGEIQSQSMFPDSMFESKNGDRNDVADTTLTRLSSQWSGNKKLPSINAESKNESIENNQITALESQEDGVSFHRIDEEVAPSFLVDWKLWGIKIAIFIVIPMSIVLCGGAKHISKISPTFGEFCHSQALLIQETIFGKDSDKVADNHFELANIYYKKKEYNRAIDHAHSASKVYVFQCLNSMYEKQRKISNSYRVRSTYKSLKPTIEKLRQSLILLARSSSAGGFHNLANKYWLMALSIEPDVYNHNYDPMPLIKIRMEAADSLARQKHYSEAKKCYDDAFSLLDLAAIQGLYSGTAADFTERTFEEMRYLVFLHKKRADYFNATMSNQAYDDIKTSATLQNHLLHFMAKKELDRNWVPKNPFMRPVDVSFRLRKGYISKIRLHHSPFRSDAKDVERCIFKTLNRSNIWQNNDTKFSALSISNRKGANMYLQFRLRKVLINQDFYNQVKTTPLFKTIKPSMYNDRDIKQNIIEISKSL